MPRTRKRAAPPEGYICPECVAEGHTDPQPIDNFYVYRAREYKTETAWYRYKDNQRRSQLCRRHDQLAAAERQRRRLDPDSPDYDPAYHERVKEQKRQYATDKLRPDGARYDPELHARQKASKRSSAARARREGES